MAQLFVGRREADFFVFFFSAIFFFRTILQAGAGEGGAELLERLDPEKGRRVHSPA